MNVHLIAMARRSKGGDAADAVRSAVDRTFQATVGQGAALTRERAQDLVDDVTQAAGRVRQVIDDLRLATGEDLNAIRSELRSLERRVSALEASREGSREPGGRKSRTGASGSRKSGSGSRASGSGSKASGGPASRSS
jgi:polyhydroxyalkanoate synthesis regulator phasin